MVAGPFLAGKEDKKPIGSPTASSLSAVPGSAIISSTSYFDSVSPHFSRQRPFKESMPVPVASHEAGPSPPSVGSSDHGDAPSAAAPPGGGGNRGYRHPPPGYGSHYPPYGYPGAPPPPPHYGGHGHGPPPPQHGYHPHHGHGQPPPGYPHHPHGHQHGYSPPPPGYPGGRPMYPGYYEGGGPPGNGYPLQHSRDGRSKTPPFQRGGPSPGSATRPTTSSSQRASPVRRDLHKSSPEQSGPSQPSSSQAGTNAGDSSSASAARASPTKVADEMETDRLRQAALTEISPAQVNPIKTAFHFFVLDMRDSLRSMAEAEVRKTLPPGQSLNSYLVNSNLNCRLMKAWEGLSEEERKACMHKEEADRRRFMEEEEIASRHCATLTARSKSPKTPERRSSNSHFAGSAEQNSRRSSPAPSPTASITNSNSNVRQAQSSPAPSPISRLVVEPSNSMDQDEKKMDDSVTSARRDRDRGTYVKDIKEEPQNNVVIHSIIGVKNSRDDQDVETPATDNDSPDNKRPSPTTKLEPNDESPPKRNRLEKLVETKATASAEASS